MPIVKDEQGKVVAKLPYTEKGETQAENIAKENQGWKVINAPDVRESYQLGGMPGQPGFGQRPSIRPPLPGTGASIGMYEEGGEVDEYKKGGKTQPKYKAYEKPALSKKQLLKKQYEERLKKAKRYFDAGSPGLPMKEAKKGGKINKPKKRAVGVQDWLPGETKKSKWSRDPFTVGSVKKQYKVHPKSRHITKKK